MRDEHLALCEGEERRGPRRRGLTALLAGCLLAGSVALSACGGGGGAANAGGNEGGEVVFFGLSQENPYIAQQERGAREVAEEQGWTLRFVETNNSQEEQDNQIRQLLASGQKPVGVILHPFLGEAAAASQQAIKNADIPLIITNQVPRKGTEQLFDAYAGVGDVHNGEVAAEILVDEAKEEGMKLGDGIVVGFPAGYIAGEDRVKGFKQALAEQSPGSSTLTVGNSEGFLEEEGYKVASQLVPANKGEFNWVYALNDALGLGVIKALRENGLEPGKDVLVTGGTCMNPSTARAVLDGELVGTAVQSPYVEGKLAALSLVKVLNSDGKVLPGEVNVAADAPPPEDGPPHKWNFMPNPAVDNTQDSYSQTEVWGRPAKNLCEYS